MQKLGLNYLVLRNQWYISVLADLRHAIANGFYKHAKALQLFSET